MELKVILGKVVARNIRPEPFIVGEIIPDGKLSPSDEDRLVVCGSVVRVKAEPVKPPIKTVTPKNVVPVKIETKAKKKVRLKAEALKQPEDDLLGGGELPKIDSLNDVIRP